MFKKITEKRETIKAITKIVSNYTISYTTTHMVNKALKPKNLKEQMILGTGAYLISVTIGDKLGDIAAAQVDAVMNSFETLDNILNNK